MRTMDNLSRLRGEINRIDDKILELVEERLSLCRRIALSKGNGRQLKLNPPRQRAVVERLQARASETAAPAVPHVWREIMAHGLQVQAPIRILIPVGYDSERLLRCVREQYGSAAPVDWAGLQEEAIGRAKVENAIAVIPGTARPSLPEGLTAFDQLRDEQGKPIGWLAGRVDG